MGPLLQRSVDHLPLRKEWQAGPSTDSLQSKALAPRTSQRRALSEAMTQLLKICKPTHHRRYLEGQCMTMVMSPMISQVREMILRCLGRNRAIRGSYSLALDLKTLNLKNQSLMMKIRTITTELIIVLRRQTFRRCR